MPLNQSNGIITTVGNATLPAAAIIGGNITRSGPTGAFTDTTDTAVGNQTSVRLTVA